MKILQMPDCHLGYAQYGMSSRKDDYKNSFIFCIELAIKEEVDAVVFTGDILDKARHYAKDEHFVREHVLRLRYKGIAVIGIEGNHDSDSGTLLSMVGIDELNDTPRDVEGISFCGISHTRIDDFLERCSNLPKHDILVVHQTIEEACPFGDRTDCNTLSDVLAGKGVIYIAAGHIHNYGQYMVGDVPFVYGGSIEMTDWNESSAKVCPIVDIQDGKVTVIPVTIPTRRLAFYTLNDNEAVDKFMNEMRDDAALITLHMESSVAKRYKEIETRAESFDILLRKSVYTKDGANVPEVPAWEKENSTVEIKKVVEQDYPKGTKEFQLINQIINNPDEWNAICTKEVQDFEESVR